MWSQMVMSNQLGFGAKGSAAFSQRVTKRGSNLSPAVVQILELAQRAARLTDGIQVHHC